MACIQGLFKQWCTAKVLLGCTLYTEILQIPSMLNLNLQEAGVDIVSGILIVFLNIGISDMGFHRHLLLLIQLMEFR